MHTHLTFKQRGFTLTELMISMGIGLFILTGLISALFVSSNLNRMSADMSLIAENIRATNQLMSTEIMQGAFDTSCTSTTTKSLSTTIHFNLPPDTLFTDISGITGYEFVGGSSTSPNPIDIRNAVGTAITPFMWRNNLPTELRTLKDATGNNIRPLFGSDILVVRYYQPILGMVIQPTVSNPPSDTAIKVTPAKSGTNVPILTNAVIALENCSDTLKQPRDIFINVSTDQSQWQGNNTKEWANTEGFNNTTQRYQYIVRAFFVANDPVSGNNHLYRFDFGTPNPFPILEGVENMQLRFHEYGRGFLNAQEVSAWNNVAAVEVSMLYQTLNVDSARYGADNQPSTINMGSAPSLTVNNTDGRYRKAVSQIITIRNNIFSFPGKDRFTDN